MYERMAIAASRKRIARLSPIYFGPWAGGLFTEQQAEMLNPDELFEALNIVLVGSGICRTRDGSSLVSTGASGQIKHGVYAKVGSTYYDVFSDSDNKVYYDASGTATLISTCQGEVRLVGFMGLLIICDGDSTKMWDGTNVDILYDDGTGSSTGQYNNYSGTDDANLALGNGTNTKVGASFSSETWDSTHTMPPTTFAAKFKKEGTGGSGSIVAYIERVSDSQEMASKTIVSDVTAITNDAIVEITFASSDITVELSTGVAYRAYLSFTNGDGNPAANHVLVKCTTVTSGGAGIYNDGAWKTDTTKDPIMRIKPGAPPKLVDAVVHEDRLFGIEGTSGTNPSYLHYSAAGDHLDWSTEDGGGYAPVIDASANNYPIGGIVSWYDDLWVFGTPGQPFLGKLSGSSPSSYAVYSTLQRVSGHYKSIVASPSDIFFLHPGGIDSIRTVQEYGDIRATNQSDNISRTIHQNYSTGAVAGYDPEFGLYVLKMEDYDYIITAHATMKSARQHGEKQIAYSPMTRWKYAFDGTPTAFWQGNGYLMVGTDDGNVYRMNNTAVQDADNDVIYKIWPYYFTVISGEMAARKVTINAFGRMGGGFSIKFYKNHSRTSFLTKTFTLPWDTTVTPDELTMDVAEMNFLIDPNTYYDRKDINFNFRALMLGLEDITLNGFPVYFGRMTVLAHSIGGL